MFLFIYLRRLFLDVVSVACACAQPLPQAKGYPCAFGFFEQYRYDRILMLVCEVGRAPKLHDTFGGHEVEISAGSVIVPGSTLLNR